MNKGLITLMAGVFGFGGSYLPVLFGNNDFGTSVLGGLVGGLFGIWVGVKLSKRF